jgi:hypothetical protein
MIENNFHSRMETTHQRSQLQYMIDYRMLPHFIEKEQQQLHHNRTIASVFNTPPTSPTHGFYLPAHHHYPSLPVPHYSESAYRNSVIMKIESPRKIASPTNDDRCDEMTEKYDLMEIGGENAVHRVLPPAEEFVCKWVNCYR